MLVETNVISIPTWTEPATLEYLRRLSGDMYVNMIVESGTYMGASARAMLSGSRGHLWCVDKFEVFGTFEITNLFLNQWINEGRCEIIRGDMDKAAQMLKHLEGNIDMCWIDDGHSEEDLRRDIRNCLPLLRKGGILVGHDWDGDNDVARGVLSMLPREKLTFPVPRVWQYIKAA